MDRFPVLIEHRNVRLSVYNKSLKITRPDHPIETIPFELISNLIIYGKAAVESDVWRHLNDHHVTATLLPGRGQGEPAFLGAALGNSTGLRLSQYNTYQQLELREQYAMHLVLQKHQTELRTLEALGINTQAFPQIAISAHHLPQLLGEEGQDAHRYYQRLKTVIDQDWGFNGRNRQPPRDPVNALLSLSYTLLTSAMHRVIQTSGLDPWLGIYHQPYPGRPSLAVDLIEPIRAEIDLWVISLLEDFTPVDFEVNALGCRLNKMARSHYYEQWGYLTQEFIGDDSMDQYCRKFVTHYIEYIKSHGHFPNPPKDPDLFNEAPF